MKSIKNFIYLDDYKMYSISSQIFEGMTEYILKGESARNEEQNQQKGNFATGRVMADIAESQSNRTEKIFMHDYSYNLFENKLIKDNRVAIIDSLSSDPISEKVMKSNFIKVSGQILLNDTKSIETVIAKFNELGVNTTIVTSGSTMSNQIEELSESLNSIKDRNQKSKTKSLITNKLNNYKAIAKDKGMQMDETYLNALKYLLNYGYQQQFEIQLPIITQTENCFFSALLKRDKFKEPEDILVKKYSRLSEKEFTIFGIITQTKENNPDEIYTSLHEKNSDSMKASVMNMINKISSLENIFVGRLNNEYVIDPIAIYQEL